MKKRTGEILELLDEKYGTEFICYLNYETPWQLLIATMLSAQCTDARVNIVTKICSGSTRLLKHLRTQT